MNIDNDPFEFLDSEEISAARVEKQENITHPTICPDCTHIMVRKVFDGVVDTVTLIECPYSATVNIQEFPVLECSYFKKEP